ncbi:MAG: MBL fold metallo-hydrolase, partial [Acidimicrobiales bacterium]
MRVGDLRVDPVVDGSGRFQPTKSFRGTTDEQWAAHRDLLDEDGLLGFAMGGFLMRGRGHTTLVDLGLGPRSFLGIDGGAFLGELAALDVAPEDVTDVVFTHLHFDHIGWARTDGGAPTFRSATYRCSEADWSYFMGRAGEEADMLDPIRERFEVWSGSGPLVSGIDTLMAPGHTPGSTVIVISAGEE